MKPCPIQQIGLLSQLPGPLQKQAFDIRHDLLRPRRQIRCSIEISRLNKDIYRGSRIASRYVPLLSPIIENPVHDRRKFFFEVLIVKFAFNGHGHQRNPLSLSSGIEPRKFFHFRTV